MKHQERIDCIKLSTLIIFFLIPFFIASMQDEQSLITESSPSLSQTQKTKKCFFNCCMPKIAKIACAYCCCGTSVIQSIQSLGEYKIAQAILPWMQNPYCLATTITVGACISCGYGMHKTQSCCFKQKHIDFIHQEKTMVYEDTVKKSQSLDK